LPYKTAFGGLLIGAVLVPMLAILGAMLCLTGLGAFLGVPMIVAAVVAPLVGPMVGLGGMVKGKCPWCGVTVRSNRAGKTFACHACSQRITVESRGFQKEQAQPALR
jgi:DNA-directed RNA polymerase subunit RPC12/RpoP